MMRTIVRPVAVAKYRMHRLSGLSPSPPWNIVEKMRKAPSLPNKSLLAELIALPILPSRWIDGWSISSILVLQQSRPIGAPGFFRG